MAELGEMMIYHIAIEPGFRNHFDDELYTPSCLSESGFIHCALRSSVIPVANDFFAETTEKLLVLKIDPQKLESALRYEAAEPITGSGTSHLDSASEFPHIYGPVNSSAIIGIATLQKSAEGYKWPAEFKPI